MFTEILEDVFDSVLSVFNGASLEALVMIVVIALFAGFRMKSLTSIFGWMFESTLLLGFGLYIYSWMMTKNPFSFATWEKQSVRAWDNAMNLSVYELVGYFSLFFLLISIIHLVKRFARG